MIVKLNEFSIVSCYISPNIGQNLFEEKVDDILENCSEGNVEFVLLGDMNAKSSLWGPTTDGRGSYLEEGLSEKDLVVLNDGVKPTFLRGNSNSYIDLTIASQNLAGEIRGWQVLDKETGTHHQYIEFTVESEQGSRKIDMTLPRTKDWEVYRAWIEILESRR